MKSLFVGLLLITALSAFGNESESNAGYTESNESAERVADDAAWDKLQEEFDKPNP